MSIQECNTHGSVVCIATVNGLESIWIRVRVLLWVFSDLCIVQAISVADRPPTNTGIKIRGFIHFQRPRCDSNPGLSSF